MTGPAQPIVVEGGGGRTSPVFIRNGVHKPHSKGPPHPKKTSTHLMATTHHSVQSPNHSKDREHNIHSVTHSTVSVHGHSHDHGPKSDVHRIKHVQHPQHQYSPVQTHNQRQKVSKSTKSSKSTKCTKSHKSKKSRHVSNGSTSGSGSVNESNKYTQSPSPNHYHTTLRSRDHRNNHNLEYDTQRSNGNGHNHDSHHPHPQHQHQQRHQQHQYRESSLRPSLATRQSSGSHRSRSSKHHKSKSHFSPRTSSRVMDKDLVIQSLEDQLLAQEQVIGALTADLSKAQQSILVMTSTVDVNQKLPTVDELLSKYQSIRDQQHADSSTALKQWIRTLSPEWPKSYISQIVHQVMFYALMSCYKVVLDHKSEIYQNIGRELNMVRSETESLSDNQCKVLHNLLGGYFRNNFERILRRKKVVQKVMALVISKWTAMEMAPFEEGSATMDHFIDYVDRACFVCWIMVLQDPVLEFYPNRWSAFSRDPGGGDHGQSHSERIRFDEKRHKRVIGSDRRSHNVLYFVWPALSNGTDLCGNGKMDVVVRDKWPQMRRQRNVNGKTLKTKKSTTIQMKAAKEERDRRNVLSVMQAISDDADRPVMTKHTPIMTLSASQYEYSSDGNEDAWPCMNKQCAIYIKHEFEVITNGRRQRTCPGCGTARWSPSQQQQQDVFVD